MKRKIGFSLGGIQIKYGDFKALEIAKKVGADTVDFALNGYTCNKNEPNNIYHKSDEEIVAYFTKIKDHAAKIGIEISQTHGRVGGYRDDEEKDRAYLEDARLDCLATSVLGCKYVVFHSATTGAFGPDTPREEMHKHNFNLFSTIIPHAVNYGVTVATETFGDSPKHGCCDFFGNTDEFMITYNRIKAVDGYKDNFCMCADTGHSNKAMRFGNPNPADVIRILGSDIKVLHLNDNDTFTDQHKIPFTGCIDWDDVFDALDEIGYNGVYNMELELSMFGKDIEVETAAYAIKVLRNYMEKRYGDN